MNPFIQELLGTAVRSGLMALAGYLVKAGLLSESDASRYVASGTLALVALAWSAYQKYQSRLKLLTAMASPTRLTEAQTIAQVNAGLAPPVSTPIADIPRAQTGTPS